MTEPSLRPQVDFRSADNDATCIYVAFFLVNLTRDVTFRFASPHVVPTVAAACAHLRDIVVPEPGYREFLLAQIRTWDGKDVHVTTTAEGSLILMPTPYATNWA